MNLKRNNILDTNTSCEEQCQSFIYERYPVDVYPLNFIHSQKFDFYLEMSAQHKNSR